MLSNRECARAQGFGNGYEFIGTRAQVKRQIGNAVPVGIARFLGARVSAALGYTPNQQPAMAS
jgi:DNA (cytosine-5)-methyltransferase 1